METTKIEEKLDVVLAELQVVINATKEYHEEFLIMYEGWKRDQKIIRDNLDEIIRKLDNNEYGLEDTQKYSVI